MIYLAIIDGVLNNEAFRHIEGENNLESWTNLLKELKFHEDMDYQEHTQFLRGRFVTGAAEWLSGSHGSRENDKEKLGYNDYEWETIWSLMLEDGAWALPSLRDKEGKYLKENLAPEMLIKFVAHDLKAHIIVFDLLLNNIQFCSGNHLKSNNVIFESPLILYATGGHFQAVFQRDHTFFLNLAKKLDIESNPIANAKLDMPCSASDVKEGKRVPSNQPNNQKKKRTESCQRRVEESKSTCEQENYEDSLESSGLQDLNKIKRKERTVEFQREYEQI